MPATYIETPRLILRQWKESDYEPYILLNQDKAVMEFFPSTMRAHESTAQIERISKHIDEHGYGFFAVERKDDHQFIGFTGLANARFESYFTPCVEIGWRLSKNNWNQGFAIEAAFACLGFGFNQLKLDDIYSFTSEYNTRSQQVMIRLGMTKDGLFGHPAIEDGHLLKQHVVYRLNSEDFKSRKK